MSRDLKVPKVWRDYRGIRDSLDYKAIRDGRVWLVCKEIKASWGFRDLRVLKVSKERKAIKDFKVSSGLRATKVS